MITAGREVCGVNGKEWVDFGDDADYQQEVRTVSSGERRRECTKVANLGGCKAGRTMALLTAVERKGSGRVWSKLIQLLAL